MRRAVLVAGLVLSILAGFAVAREVPYLGGRVNDLAGMLSTDAAQRLEQSLQQLEEETGAQLVVLTVDSLEGEPLEDFSLRVAETWQLGRKGVDDGVLLLIAKSDRKIRIEVGYGLEPTLTDAHSRRIIDNILRPRFRAGDFSGGIEEAVNAIAGTIRGQEVVPDGPPAAVSAFQQEPAAAVMGMLIFVVVVGVFSIAATFSKGCSGWFLYLFLMPFYLAFPAAFLGPGIGGSLFLGWVVLFPIIRLLVWRTDAGKAFRTAHPGWIAVGSSSGRSSGGWSSGGFSGGGGSFGGGGASGGW